MNTDVLIGNQDPILTIEKEVMFLDGLNEVEQLSTDASVKMEYNWKLAARSKFVCRLENCCWFLPESCCTP